LHYLLAKLKIEEIMTPDPVTISQVATIGEVARVMLDYKISGLEQCVAVGLKATDLYAKRQTHREQGTGPIRRGIGMAVMIHGSGIAALDMAAATLKR
jgi:hypothetical protein